VRSSSDQVLDRLDSGMRDFVARQDMAFIATSDSGGECDARFRAGAPGFIHVLDERTLAYPEYRVTGRPARPSENPHIGILLIDIERDLLGLHVNGTARIVDDATLRDYVGDLPVAAAGAADGVEAGNGRRPERWVVVSVREAYVQPRQSTSQTADPVRQTADPIRVINSRAAAVQRGRTRVDRRAGAAG
jgi:predicted pyridoxine 5'-phosphate oxidase superfamily flavin-nucleotide-binding protein